MRLLAISFNAILTTFLGLFGIGSLNLENFTKQYKAIDYGLKVKVDGLNMTVNIAGEHHNQTIVFLPGLATISPYLIYKSFTEPLSEDFRVITVEPFGYGLSDLTEKARTNENIVKELHDCLQTLGVDKYYLMAHSLSGIYSVAYANKYSEEVEGFIGLDITPTNYIVNDNKDSFGKKIERGIAIYASKKHLYRFLAELAKYTDLFIKLDPNYKYTEEEIKDIFIIGGYTFSNENMIDEQDYMKENIENVSTMVFKCPALLFIAQDSINEDKTLVDGNNNMIGNPENSEVIQLEGSHNMHIDQKEFILKKVKEWII